MTKTLLLKTLFENKLPPEVIEAVYEKMKNFSEELSPAELEEIEIFCEEMQQKSLTNIMALNQASNKIIDTFESAHKEYIRDVDELNELVELAVDDIKQQSVN